MPNPRDPIVDQLEPRILRTPEAEWRVYEQSRAYDRRSRPGLVFASDAVIRRVREYPSNWRELTDAELWEISWKS